MSRLLPQQLRDWISIHWPVVVLIPMAAVAVIVLFWLFDRTTGSDLSANVPAELIGVAISAVVTVLIVERAISRAEQRRLKPAVESVGHRMQDMCDHCITLLAMYARPTGQIDLAEAGQKGREEWLRDALDKRVAFSHTGREIRHMVYTELTPYHQRLQDLAVERQIIIEQNPRLDPLLARLQKGMSVWFIHRRGFDPQAEQYLSEHPDSKQAELVTIRGVASTFLDLSDEIRKMRGVSIDDDIP